MNKSKTLSVIGGIAMVVGLIAEFVGNWVGNKQTEEMVDEKIKLALEEHEENK